ncbi:MAG: ABC transporter permease [Bryobacteraceae bacterium]|nr:ABC transporter permease [Bryobacteraceae bacterium]
MSLWRQLRHGVRTLLWRSRADGELDEEARHFAEEAAAAHEARGMGKEEARRMARLEMGSALQIREEVREAGWESGLTGFLDDLRYGARRLVRSPGFTAAGIITLALGIGATSALFAVVYTVLLRPLPYPHAERVVALVHTAPGANLKRLRMSPSLYFTYREESRVFDAVALWNGRRATVTGVGEAEQVPTLFVSHEFLDVLGVAPALGRGFRSGDDDGQSPRTAILSDGYWRQRFGGSPGVLGRRLVVESQPHEVIGVLPAGFDFLGEKAALLVPFRFRREQIRLIQFSEDGIARLKPGVTVKEANADVARCLLLAPRKFPMNAGFAANAFSDARISPTVRSLKDEAVGDVGGTLWLLMAGVGVLLAIACANVSNLALVRVEARRREFAVRAALGAGWGRMARDVMTECAVLGFMGGAAGLGLCAGVIRWLGPGSLFEPLPRAAEIGLDAWVVAFAMLLSMLCAMGVGLVPLWRASKDWTTEAVRGGGERMSASRERRTTQRGLLVMQLGLATVLLIASGLLLRTLAALRSVDAGFTAPQEVQAARVSIPVALVGSTEMVMRQQEAILRKFEALPGTTAAAIATSLPLEGANYDPVYVEGRDYGHDRLPPVRRMRRVSPGYMQALGGRLLAGRDLTWQDVYGFAPVALVSESMAREVWGEPVNGLGKRVRASLGEPWREVIGVVGDVRDDELTAAAPAMVYWPLGHRDAAGNASATRHVDYLVRSKRAGSVGYVKEMREALRSVNEHVPLANVRTLEEVRAKAMSTRALALVLLGVAGIMGLLLGVVGVYGVVAYSAGQRRREIAIRMAVGCTPRAVVQMFMREGLMAAAVGGALGLAAGIGAARAMRTLLFGVGTVDVGTLVVAWCVVAGAAGLASWAPASRAARTDPARALRG